MSNKIIQFVVALSSSPERMQTHVALSDKVEMQDCSMLDGTPCLAFVSLFS